MELKTYLEKTKTSQASFAARLNVSPGMVYQWVTRRRPISPEKCVLIERITGGDVTRKDTHPEDWQDIWPELAAPRRRRAA